MFQSEGEFVRWLERHTPMCGARVRVGIGDDAALVAVRRGCELILTTDLSIEGVHFLWHLHPPESVGHRALARSLSDVAAMGGVPRFALVSLAMSKRTSRTWVEKFYAGLSTLGKRFGVPLIGGDTAVVSDRTTIDVTVAGEVAHGRALLRSSARPGDRIFVSGGLGLAALGLRLLKSQRAGLKRSAPPPQAIKAHLYPEPRCVLGRFLAEKRMASALIDLSDGLSTDLARLCAASGVGARILADCIPAAGLSAGSKPRAGDPLDLVLHGGEDYELLFTVPPRRVRQIPYKFRGIPLSEIGVIERGRKLTLVHPNGQEELLAPRGFDHFRKK